MIIYIIKRINFFFFNQKTAYELRISDWSSDVFSSDLEYRLLDLAYAAAPLREHVPGTPVALPANPLAEPDLASAERHSVSFGGGMMSGMMGSGSGGMMGGGMMGGGMMGGMGRMMQGMQHGKIGRAHV